MTRAPSRRPTGDPGAPTALVRAAARAMTGSAAVNGLRRRDALAEAEELLGRACGGEGTGALDGRARRRFDALVARRVAGEPFAFIVGHVDFCGLRFPATRGVFVPRPSSELLVLEATRRLRGRRRPLVVDVATGQGPIALAVASRVPTAEIIGLDVSTAAVRAAAANARRLGLGRARFRSGAGLEPLPRRCAGQVDVMTCHPPYIPAPEVRDLPLELRGHEPVHTLTDGSADGLGLIRELAAQTPGWLRPGGWLLLEVGPDRIRAAAAAVRPHLDDVRSVGDRTWPTRVLAARCLRLR